ncbi:uncharacterized protein CBL_02452 [Carabus blaptoides fortunei]
MQNLNRFVTEQVTQMMFHGNLEYGEDLISFDIQRGRDHGIPTYNSMRVRCGRTNASSFDDLVDDLGHKNIELLSGVYDDVADVDLFVGGILEKPVAGALVGPTFQCIIGEQFVRKKFGDRFWYEVGGAIHSFTNDQLQEIRKSSLSRLICDNSDNINEIQPNSFRSSAHKGNALVSCSDLPSLNLVQRYCCKPDLRIFDSTKVNRIMTSEDVLIITAEEEDAIKKTFNRSDTEIAEDVKYLKEWFQKQPHLPENQDDVFLIAMLQRNKFSLEKTKKKLDMLYTVRTIVPDFLSDREPLNPQMQRVLDTFIYTPLPLLTDDLDRVHYFRLIKCDVELFDVPGFTKLAVNTMELRFLYDKAVTDRYIFDYTNYTMGHVVKLTPVYFKKFYAVLESAYTDRVRGIHFMNVPPVAMTIIKLLKSVLKEKIASRIYIHENIDSLHKIIPKRILPSDLGGTEKSLNEIYGNWRKFYESHNSWFLKEQTKQSNEKLRPGRPADSNMFGFEGSFRQLSLD